MYKKIIRKIPFEVLIVILYLFAGSLWILSSDNLVSALSDKESTLNNLQHYKGWFFVLTTAFALYIIIKQYVKRVRQEEDKSKQHELLKIEFIRNISHELRTPMNAIIGFSELAMSLEDKNSKTKQYLEIIDKSSKQLLTIVTDVVDTSLLVSGNMIVVPNNFELWTFMKSIFSYFNPLMTENVNLRMDCDQAGEDIILYTDEEKIRRIFHNLINNAIKYTYKGMIRIGFNLEKTKIVFFVEDTGTGIKPHLHTNIFNQFKQNDVEFENRSSGTGLGLSICKEMIGLLNGKIWLESQTGKGTKFYFSLPLTNSANNSNAILIQDGAARNTLN